VAKYLEAEHGSFERYVIWDAPRWWLFHSDEAAALTRLKMAVAAKDAAMAAAEEAAVAKRQAGMAATDDVEAAPPPAPIQVYRRELTAEDLAALERQRDEARVREKLIRKEKADSERRRAAQRAALEERRRREEANVRQAAEEIAALDDLLRGIGGWS
jgi:hypothetical protein